MFTVYFINHFYFSGQTFDSVEKALAYAKTTSFECAIYQGDQIVASYGYFQGTRYYN